MVRGKKGGRAEKEGHTVSAWRCLRYRVYTVVIYVLYSTILYCTVLYTYNYNTNHTVL
jgi:hypothetical protein